MIFQELNGTQCKTYLAGCENTHKAVLVDPVRERIDRYLAVLAYHGLKLDAIVDTHTHADHATASFEFQRLLGVRLIMHRRAPVPRVDEYVDDGDSICVGDVKLDVLYTPGHTPDSISLYVSDRVLTGDVMLIRGTGRADFAGGDAGIQYDSITGKLFELPDDTLVFPGHDYRGNTQSTIGEEKQHNPRIAGRSRKQYIELMNSIEFPLPSKIQEVLQPNQTAIDDDRTAFPDLAELSQVRQLSPGEVYARLKTDPAPLLLDVREPDEYTGELGHIPRSQLIPLKELSQRVGELNAYRDTPIIVVCRAGVRSTTAAAMLTGLGFSQVSNLKGGMLDWNDEEFAVER
ncbi:MAG: MBL fold metallo-hydrolase [Gammaproteobacteria bacterium]|nr:MBL fold metallo-hydrolase [Gammaproteobacteria bacterium]